LTIDLGRSLRRTKTDKRRAQIVTRPRNELVSAADIAGAGRATLLLDTNVYIQAAAGTLPGTVAALVNRGLLFHCSVCMAELATGVANADPVRTGWKATRDHYTALMARIPPSRLLTPDTDIWVEAGVVAGTLARCQGYQRHQRKECLNDALIFLTATKAGLPVLTANRDDFDLIQQLVPHGQFIHF
jgi:predicted nucleic acid-binding protein